MDLEEILKKKNGEWTREEYWFVRDSLPSGRDMSDDDVQLLFRLGDIEAALILADGGDPYDDD